MDVLGELNQAYIEKVSKRGEGIEDGRLTIEDPVPCIGKPEVSVPSVMIGDGTKANRLATAADVTSLYDKVLEVEHLTSSSTDNNAFKKELPIPADAFASGLGGSVAIHVFSGTGVDNSGTESGIDTYVEGLSISKDKPQALTLIAYPTSEAMTKGNRIALRVFATMSMRGIIGYITDLLSGRILERRYILLDNMKEGEVLTLDLFPSISPVLYKDMGASLCNTETFVGTEPMFSIGSKQYSFGPMKLEGVVAKKEVLITKPEGPVTELRNVFNPTGWVYLVPYENAGVSSLTSLSRVLIRRAEEGDEGTDESRLRIQTGLYSLTSPNMVYATPVDDQPDGDYWRPVDPIIDTMYARFTYEGPKMYYTAPGRVELNALRGVRDLADAFKLKYTISLSPAPTEFTQEA